MPIIRRQPPARTIYDQWQNLLPTLLTPAGAPPPAGTRTNVDYPNPQGYHLSSKAQPTVGLKTWSSSRVHSLLLGQDTFFGPPGYAPEYDYPNPIAYDPKSRAQPAIALKTWTDSFKLPLAGKDRFFSADGIGPDYDYPNPVGHDVRSNAKPVISLKTWIDTLNILTGQDQFFGLAGNPTFDWPVPKGAIPSIDLKTWINRLNVLSGNDSFFGLAGNPTFDWPNPRGYIPSISLKTWNNDLIRTTLLGQDQFFGLAGHPVFDWPNPRGSIPSIALRTWALDLLASTLGIIALGGIEIDAETGRVSFSMSAALSGATGSGLIGTASPQNSSILTGNLIQVVPGNVDFLMQAGAYRHGGGTPTTRVRPVRLSVLERIFKRMERQK